ncbi:hypothetical protein QQS21_002968 [Conoideocrella luteorostrata]|uniref:Ethyl tert-butyl ether degradation EthD n=1 Tax=Conoideocrella luteorostrata TaxID=1105319 RepID=A0AAJ0CUA8_9HYPO|nr:hypothetical protein QQS21_002968 [Conoideocrella luteorostrata]
MASITLLYPSGHDFDLKYYLSTHMPIVETQWKSDGLRSWEITQFEPGLPYQIQAVLKFDTLAEWEAASTGKNAPPVFDDIPKFTTAQPVVLKGSHKAFQKVA